MKIVRVPAVFVVCGSRDWPALWFVTAKMIELIPHGSMVITGGASGVDRHANREAIRLKYLTKVITADWDKYGKRAGPIRNNWMLDEEPDGVLAFLYQNSRGTAHMIRSAYKRGISLHVFTERDLQPDISALDMGDIE